MSGTQWHSMPRQSSAHLMFLQPATVHTPKRRAAITSAEAGRYSGIAANAVSKFVWQRRAYPSDSSFASWEISAVKAWSRKRE